MAIRIVGVPEGDKLQDYDQKNKMSLKEILWLIAVYAFVITVAISVLTEMFK